MAGTAKSKDTVNVEGYGASGEEKKKNPLRDVTFLSGLALVVMGVAIIIVMVALWENTESIQTHGRLGVVFDVGGSGTRMYVYEYTNDDEMKQIYYQECEDEGATNQELHTLQQKMVECVKKGEQAVPQQVVSTVPVYMGATAGMRLVKFSNRSKYDGIWNTLAAVLKNSSLLIRYNDTLPGSKEASYSWTTINKLQDKTFLTGLFEMGSSSAQVAFDIENGTLAFHENVTLNRKTHNLHAASYLCYGQREFVRRYKANLMYQAQLKGDNFTNDPCSYRNYTSVKERDYFFNQPCIDGQVGEEIFGKKISLNGSSFEFRGTGIFSLCLSQVRETLKNALHVNATVPTNENYFVGIGGGTVFASRFLNLPEVTNMSDYMVATGKLCNMSIEEVKNRAGSGFSKFTYDYCLADAYSYVLLKDVAGLKNDGNLEFQNKINDKKVTWTLGLILNHIKEMSQAIFEDEHRFSKALFIVMLVLASILVVFGVMQIMRYVLA